jgi:5-methylcytosine-specific restriction endonuclease McrA
MAWKDKLIMTDKRIRQRKAEKKYRESHKLNQANRTPEQQESYRNMWNKYDKGNGKTKVEKMGKLLGVDKMASKLIIWKSDIKNRDKSCQICGSSTNLISHHILHKEYYPKMALNTNNGIVLCNEHHNECHGVCLN